MRDPIREVVAQATGSVLEEPPPEELLKGKADDESGTGGPAAGRSSVEHARAAGVRGWLQLLGPGLVTGASDDDPSGIGTYSQTGSQFGYGVLWTALFTFPLMAAVQELCARIALQTGVGLGTSLRRKFPTPLVGACILALVVANTINVGADLGAVAAAGELLSRGHVKAAWLVVPVGVGVTVALLTVSYTRIFRIFKWLTLALFAYVITLVFAHPNGMQTLRSTFIPHVEMSQEFIAAIVAILGTTISPYLFFWQASSEVEEVRAAQPDRQTASGVRSRELRAARVDIMLGMAFSQLIMYCIILSGAAVLNAHGVTGVQTAQQAADALRPLAGDYAFVIFSVGMIGTGLLAIPILTGSASYAVKEFLGLRGSLAVKAQYRPTFYAIMVASMLAGMALNFVGLDPIHALFVTAVINGLVAPPLLVLIVLLGQDRGVMRSKVSGRLSRTLGWAAAAVMSAAAIALVVTTVPH